MNIITENIMMILKQYETPLLLSQSKSAKEYFVSEGGT